MIEHRKRVFCPSAAGSVALAVLTLGTCCGQGTSPKFEVASLKRVTYSGAIERLETTPGSVRCTCRLTVLVRQAYHLDVYQLVGQPSWFSREFYQLAAKLREGATKDDIRAMLGQLLGERLHLAVHWENRETPVYALVIGKGGLKLKRPGEPGSVGVSRPRFALAGDGHMHYEAVVPLANLAGGLNGLVDRRVVDETRTEGKFEIVLDATVLQKPPPFLAGGPEPDPALPADGPTPDSAPSIFSAIQKLGLKLEPVKRPLKYLVIDGVDRDPTEN
ncbi:MAG TPA: TIGR03435 family protein [Bryobacteraceae bacterium]|jgi:uncharacterized protein (TIGR03435 family)